MSARPEAERSKTTVLTFRDRHHEGRPLALVTAYDFPTARAADEAGIDGILVGDSLAMVVLGHPNTLSVTMDEMLHHARAVSRGASKALLIGDLPFLSYQADEGDAVRNAGRFLAESGMDAVKLEGGKAFVSTIRAIVRAGIPVQGHIGLTPQRANALGGFRVQGKTAPDAQALLDDARALEDAGCFSIVLEAMPDRLAAHITAQISIPTVGIGAGPGTSGQILVLHDLIGLTVGHSPKFVKRYADVGGDIRRAIGAYRADVEARAFPAPEHSYAMADEEWDAFRGTADEGWPPARARPRPLMLRATILGTGALGTLFAARLGRTLGVTVGGTWAAGLDALARRGACVDGEPDVPVAARPLESLDTPADLVLVLVKAGQTAALAPVAARLLAPGGVIVTLQNGVGAREVLAAGAGADRVGAGVTTVGATLTAPGRVRAFPGHVVLEAHPSPVLQGLADALARAGLPTEVVSDLEPHVWRKLAVNCALNAVTAVLDVPNGAVLDDPEARGLAEAAAREVAAVARARGIVLAGDPAVDALAIARRTVANRSSMLRDLDRGVATEVEFLNGAVEREGRRLGVPTPVNTQLARQVRELSAAGMRKVLS